MSEARLQKLRAGLQAIPRKRQRAGLLAILSQYATRTADAERLLADASQADGCVVELFPSLPPGAANGPRKRAAGIAARAGRRLRDDLGQVRAREMEDDVIALADAGKAAEKAVRERWVRQMDDRSKTYGALVRAAERAGLAGSRAMATHLTVLATRTNKPPLTADDIATVRRALEGLADTVAHLGLQGAPGKFIEAAAAGRGDARALANPEVREFIERHDLWNLLVVAFRS
jgi:hypothetical protein